MSIHISLAAEPVFHIGSFVVTNSLLHAWITALILIVVAIVVGSRLQRTPKGLQNIVEVIISFLLDLSDSVTGDRKKSIKFFPLVTTIFFFVFVSNYLGLLPGVGSIGFYELVHGEEVFVPYLRSSAADLNMTLAISLITVITTHTFGIAALGFFQHWGKFIQVHKLFTIKKGLPIPRPVGVIDVFIGLLELVGEVSKVISFSFRLFGNVFAGEVLLLVITSLVAYVAPVPFYFLELFVGFIQAFVFATLALVFMQVATLSHDEEEHEEHTEHKEEVPAH